jgi:hypothetical protein
MPSYIGESVLAICILASILILLGQPPVYKDSRLSSALTDLSSPPSPDRRTTSLGPYRATRPCRHPGCIWLPRLIESFFEQHLPALRQWSVEPWKWTSPAFGDGGAEVQQVRGSARVASAAALHAHPHATVCRLVLALDGHHPKPGQAQNPRIAGSETRCSVRILLRRQYTGSLSRCSPVNCLPALGYAGGCRTESGGWFPRSSRWQAMG